MSSQNQVIDFHVHAFPDELAARAIPQMSARAGVPACFDGTVRGLLASMRSHGIDISVLQPVATKPEQVEGINRWSAELRAEPGLLSFGALHPDQEVEALERQITFLLANGFRGVKLHPDYQRFHPDEDRMESLYARLERAGLAVLFHAGVDLGLYPPLMGAPEQIEQVQKVFPRLTIIAAHMGGFRRWDDVERHLVGTPVWLDTAYCADDCPTERFREMVQGHGSGKVLFASDGPWADQGRSLEFIRRVGLPVEDVRAIEGENARALLKI